MNLFISRQNLRESSHNLLFKNIFVEDSEKTSTCLKSSTDSLSTRLRVDGRGDPDVFNGVKKFIFNRLENEHLPNFLNFVAIKRM